MSYTNYHIFFRLSSIRLNETHYKSIHLLRSYFQTTVIWIWNEIYPSYDTEEWYVHPADNTGIWYTHVSAISSLFFKKRIFIIITRPKPHKPTHIWPLQHNLHSKIERYKINWKYIEFPWTRDHINILMIIQQIRIMQCAMKHWMYMNYYCTL